MAPNSIVARPVWVCSLPALAVFLTFLWFRKKRLQTDKGGGGEPVTSTVDSQIDLIVPEKDTTQAEEVEENPIAVEEEQLVCSEVKVVENEVTSTVADVPEEIVSVPQEAEEESAKTATQHEEKSSPGSKWAKKRRGGKKVVVDTMDAKSETTLEQQLSNLKIAGDDVVEAEKNKNTEAESAAAAVAGRDSANTSPADVMLASPSLSGYSDTHSEGSSDSGKGCSDVLTPSPTPVSGNSLSGDLPCDLPTHCIYEFVIPQHLVGRLIGRNGSHITEIKECSHATVYIKRHPDTTKLKICAIEGTQLDIDNALEMIRQKFPKKKYPNVTLEQLEPPPEPQILPPVLPENMLLYLVEGVNNDVILSSLVSAGHFFLQQPTHPTFPALNRLNQCMAMCYAEPNLPRLPDDVQPGSLCAAPVHDGWYRADVTNYPEGEYCEIKFVDYGGYMNIEKAALRQIRADFVTLPFQASECFLAAVTPLGDEWSPEAKELVETLTLGKVLQAQIHGYTDYGVPLIFLYTVHENQVVSINEELVANGLAEWLIPEPEIVEEVTDPAYVQAQNATEVQQQPLTA